MPRPERVTNEDISRWDEIIEKDEILPSEVKQNPVIREVCYAGQWLSEELEKVGCPEEFVVRITYTAGQLCFGRDIWEVHQDMLKAFINNELEYEPDYNEVN